MKKITTIGEARDAIKRRFTRDGNADYLAKCKIIHVSIEKGCLFFRLLTERCGTKLIDCYSLSVDSLGRVGRMTRNSAGSLVYRSEDEEECLFPDNPEAGSFYRLRGEMTATGETHTSSTGTTFPIFEAAGRRGAYSGTPVKIGDRVNITMNGIGPGTVKAFFVESGYLGIEAKPDEVPAYFNEEQRKNFPTILVFGAEFKPLAEEKK